MQEPIEFVSEVAVVQIPDGTPLVVPEGTRGYVIQVLGGNFTVRLELGHLVRVAGADAAAIGRDVPSEAIAPTGADFDEAQVWAQLRTCFDPEIPVNIVELGLVYSAEVRPDDEGGRVVEVRMTLTAPGCGMGEVLVDDVRSKLEMIPTVAEADVELVFDPPWGRSMMSELAKLETGML
jgi:probable FeS assembly SUF system protein SufT